MAVVLNLTSEIEEVKKDKRELQKAVRNAENRTKKAEDKVKKLEKPKKDSQAEPSVNSRIIELETML